MAGHSHIEIIGAKQHNLKNVSVKIPRGSFTVVTGPSGSGKSSLAFNTLFAEGQRRFLESLSTYARQFMEKHEKPDVEAIHGLSPTIAIEQKNQVKSSRSTVGTATEIYDYLRLVFAKMGEMYDPKTGERVTKNVVGEVVRELLRYEGQRAYVVFPIELGAKVKVQDRKRLLLSFMERGFVRVIAADQFDRKTLDVMELEAELKAKGSSILGKAKVAVQLYVVVDRLAVASDTQGRLADALTLAYSEGFGRARVVIVDADHKILHLGRYTEYPSVGDGDAQFPELSPALFSFNSPIGACPHCRGFGNTLELDPDLIVPNPDLSISQGAVEPLTKPSMKGYLKDLLLFCQAWKIPLNLPWRQLKAEDRVRIWNGDKGFDGIHKVFGELEENKYKVEVRVFLSRYRSPQVCPKCKGTRLKPEALSVKFHGKTIGEISAMTIEDFAAWFAKLEFSRDEKIIGKDIFPQIQSRLEFLLRVGLDYLSLSRLAKTLSGGESQRIALANQLASRLTQTTYVLDEPSIGLHPKDTENLIGILNDLAALKNTVVVVEHDPDIIQKAEYLIDLGPDAGENGGELLFQGPYKEFAKKHSDRSQTARFLDGKDYVPVPSRRRIERMRDQKKEISWLELSGCTENNLKNVHVKIPLGLLTCITGVSGSGKSSAIRKTLYPVLARMHGLRAETPGAHEKLSGFSKLRTVKLIDQEPIGKSPRSNPVTFIKAFDDIRQAMANTHDARKERLHAGHFSFNVPGGRCENCQGDGYVCVEMVFMEDIYVLCDICEGKRFKDNILKVRYQGKNIHEILQLTVTEAIAFFANERKLHRYLEILKRVGLGYLRLGQPSNTLSGGECQRLKIARELMQADNTDQLYVLDEPTTGLHFRDVKVLLKVLHQLVENGNTVVVIEHNTEVMKSSDWIIDFGPGGGIHGGEIVYEGEPEGIEKAKRSETRRFLVQALKDSPKQTMTSFLEPDPSVSAVTSI